MGQKAPRSWLWTLAILLLASACGGGGGNGATTLEGNEALEGAVGVGLSTGAALSTLFLDVDLGIEEAMNDSAASLASHGSGGGAGSVETACDLGGSQSSDCSVDERSGKSTIDIQFSDCRSATAPGGQRRRDGHLRLIVLDPLVCITGTLRDDIPFSLVLDGFHSRIDDEEGRQIAAIDADLTEDITVAADGCLTSDGTRSATGSLDVEIAAEGIHLSMEVTDLHFEIASSGTPCEQRIVANGLMEVDDRTNGLRFSQVLDDTEITLSGDVDDALVRLDGDIDNDCLGSLRFSTTAPLALTAADGCPRAGSFSVAVADEALGSVDFRDGGVDFDFADDGSTDLSVASCRDAALAQCTAR
jgi:hypothetical protein